MMWLPTSAIACTVTLACLLFFIVRPYLSLAVPQARLPLALAAAGPALSAVLMVAQTYLYMMLGPSVSMLGHLAADALLWGGLGFAAFVSLNAPEGGLSAAVQRFSTPAILTAAGLALGVLNVAASFLRLLPLPFVVLQTAGVLLTVFGLASFMNAAWPVRDAAPPMLTRHRAPETGAIFFPGLVGFFATGFLLVALLQRMPDLPADMEGRLLTSKIADLVCLDILLVAWGYYILRGFPFFWILERRPEGIVWIFIKETRHIRGAASWTSWAANVGVDTGQILTLQTGSSNQDAEQICYVISQMCPGAMGGYNATLQAQFAQDPASMRRAPGRL